MLTPNKVVSRQYKTSPKWLPLRDLHFSAFDLFLSICYIIFSSFGKLPFDNILMLLHPLQYFLLWPFLGTSISPILMKGNPSTKLSSFNHELCQKGISPFLIYRKKEKNLLNIPLNPTKCLQA